MQGCLQIFGVLFSLYFSSTKAKIMVMKKNLNLQEILPIDDIIGNFKTESKLECALRCSLMEGCTYMLYHSQTNTCTLHQFLGVNPETEPVNTANSDGWIRLEACLVSTAEDAIDCSDLGNGTCSGVHYISPDNIQRVPVYCDMTKDGGGWTVIQRNSGYLELDFQRNWTEYERGFGDPYGDYWLGNKLMHTMTFNHIYELRIDLTTDTDDLKYAVYKLFKVNSKSDNYRLQIGSFSGNTVNRMGMANGRRFSTTDRDYDRIMGECVPHQGPWWHQYCGSAALNRRIPYWNGLSVQNSVMMIRRL